MKNLPSIHCLFKWNDKKREWKRIKTFVDIGDGKEANKASSLMYTKDGKDGKNTKKKEGMMYLAWDHYSGIWLRDFTPPFPCEWISSYYLVCNDKEWMTNIEGGFDVKMDTANEVERVILEMCKCK